MGGSGAILKARGICVGMQVRRRLVFFEMKVSGQRIGSMIVFPRKPLAVLFDFVLK